MKSLIDSLRFCSDGNIEKVDFDSVNPLEVFNSKLCSQERDLNAMIDNSPQRENNHALQSDMDVNTKALPNLCQTDETHTHWWPTGRAGSTVSL